MDSEVTNSLRWALKGWAFYKVRVGAAFGHTGQSDSDVAAW